MNEKKREIPATHFFFFRSAVIIYLQNNMLLLSLSSDRRRKLHFSVRKGGENVCDSYNISLDKLTNKLDIINEADSLQYLRRIYK